MPLVPFWARTQGPHDPLLPHELSVCSWGRTDHWGTQALPEGPGSVGGP
ncbi:unnamed protein product [Staurois parvus]|uniref:Uncharacterized protein n=1 Tax=Staurois parvus TaxID=386267 RepID=A0ABN9CAP5_9NEOB|nr:unnamed protein product [Staurois parvus]